MRQKIIIYQVFTRLFGNKKTVNKPWGTIHENGVGKFGDLTYHGLNAIRDLGVTHIWFTGVPHHALTTDYSDFGIPGDDPQVVKGRAGSPYAVRDYYNVDPDLAEDPTRRLEEFRELLERTHRTGLKALIDIVPNHVARRYQGLNNPPGVMDFGAEDDTSVTWARNNNFYYIPGERFQLPEFPKGRKPHGGEAHPQRDIQFLEFPAKWTGNGSRAAQPGFNDWYETVKINFGIDPEGNKAFPELPEAFRSLGFGQHYSFWKDREVPDSWQKFRDIAHFWLALGVDGFRYDMAEMVPVECWSYLNSSIKNVNPSALLLAEVYNPDLYRDYIHFGKMDLLYDKVQLYDTLRLVMQDRAGTDAIPPILEYLSDIEPHMLRFLENHDEQRIASPEFAGNAEKGKPAMALTATLGSSAILLYFGQEVGEPGAENAGFGSPSRTSIFDYIGVPHHQRWMNGGAFDGGQLSAEERSLRDFYSRLLNLARDSPALSGDYAGLHRINRKATMGYTDRVFSFLRWSEAEKMLIVVNFDAGESHHFNLFVPAGLLKAWNLDKGSYLFEEQLYKNFKATLYVSDHGGHMELSPGPLESYILKLI